MDAGQIIEPLVSVPTASDARRSDMAAPEPDDEPQALLDSICGFRVSPPTALQPLIEDSERKFAHSDKLVLPKIIAPAAFSFSTIGASRPVSLAISAIEPAVVGISLLSILSFSSTGIPARGPSVSPFASRLSMAFASVSALGFNAKTLFTFSSSRSIRAR